MNKITVAERQTLLEALEECGYDAAEPAEDQDTTGLLSLLVQANGLPVLRMPDGLQTLIEWGLYTEADIDGPIGGVLLSLAPIAGPYNAQLSTRYIELRDIFAEADESLVDWLAHTLDNIAERLNDLLPYFTRAFGEAPRFVAHFAAQQWQRDSAVEVDPLGDEEWDITDAFTQLRPDYQEHLLHQMGFRGFALDSHDLLKEDPNAPQWIREWSGPFDITIRVEGES